MLSTTKRKRNVGKLMFNILNFCNLFGGINYHVKIEKGNTSESVSTITVKQIQIH